jgi:hypothetical protein
MYEKHSRLVVESGKPRRYIIVPKEVDGFGILRAELAKHSPIVVAPQHPRNGIIGVAATLASLLCWGLVTWSKDAGVAMAAGAIALVLLSWESYRLSALLRERVSGSLLWMLIGLGWFTAGVLIYFRIARGN